MQLPDGWVAVVDDTDLENSWRLQVRTVPTLLRVEDGAEVERTEGWLRERWEALTGVGDLGPGLPDHRPGCGSRSVEWGVEEALERRHGGRRLAARRVELAHLERRGVVGVFLVSEVFAEPARVQGPALSFPAPFVLVPHPAQDRTDAELQGVADACYPAVVAAVTG